MIDNNNSVTQPTLSPAKPRFRPFPVKTLFNRHWGWMTLLVLVAMGVMIRLGIWQLNRLEQRRTRNAVITHQLAQPPLQITGSNIIPEDLTTIAAKQATATGNFDFSRQVALLHQNWQGSPGIHLLTPLLIDGGSQAVLIDRGWIPFDESLPEKWEQFNEPGNVSVTGYVQLTETLPDSAVQPAQNSVESPQTEWFRIDVEAIQAQLPYELLPVYVMQLPPTENNNTLPYRLKPEVDLSEGPHLGYAIQWFIFAAIAGLGYIYLVGKETAKK